MTDFGKQKGFSITRSPFPFNFFMRWFKSLILLLDDLDIDGKIDTGSALVATGNELNRHIVIKRRVRQGCVFKEKSPYFLSKIGPFCTLRGILSKNSNPPVKGI